MKVQIQRLLRTLGVYHRTKASWLYDLYWFIADKRLVDERQREVEFYDKVLGTFKKGDIVFDIGANHGYKVDIFLRLGARIIAVEPDDACRAILAEKFLKYRIRKKPVVIVAKAVSDKQGPVRMWVDTPGSAKNTLSSKWAEILRDDESRFGARLAFEQSKEVDTVTLESLISQYGAPLYVKIDVEGYELNVLRGLQRPVPYLSFEANLPEFTEEAAECVRVLDHVAPHGRFNYSADCQKGLLLDKWLASHDFLPCLNQCGYKSVEVFWSTVEGSYRAAARKGDAENCKGD